jgi:hypothetical protein
MTMGLGKLTTLLLLDSLGNSVDLWYYAPEEAEMREKEAGIAEGAGRERGGDIGCKTLAFGAWRIPALGDHEMKRSDNEE